MSTVATLETSIIRLQQLSGYSFPAEAGRNAASRRKALHERHNASVSSPLQSLQDKEAHKGMNGDMPKSLLSGFS